MWSYLDIKAEWYSIGAIMQEMNLQVNVSKLHTPSFFIQNITFHQTLYSFRQLDPTEVTITYSWSHIMSY